MRRVVYSVAMRLDGYIAGPQGGYDWIVMDPEIDFDVMFKRYDAVLMGRKAYDAAKQSGYGMPKPETYVFSKTLQQADAPDVTVSNDPQKTVTALKKQKGKDIWLWGGGELFRSVLELGLVDQLEVVIFFFFNDTATTEIYTLSLHDALPIYRRRRPRRAGGHQRRPQRAPG